MKNVLMIGVFDCFHQGHLNLIKKASEFGKLTVGVVCDKAVKRQKGKNRPFHDEMFRMELIKSLKMVDRVFPVSDFDIQELHSKAGSFDLVVRGEDQSHVVGFNSLLDAGIPILELPRTKGISTSDIIKRLGDK